MNAVLVPEPLDLAEAEESESIAKAGPTGIPQGRAAVYRSPFLSLPFAVRGCPSRCATAASWTANATACSPERSYATGTARTRGAGGPRDLLLLVAPLHTLKARRRPAQEGTDFDIFGVLPVEPPSPEYLFEVILAA